MMRWLFSLLLLQNFILLHANEIVWFQHMRPPWMINQGEFKDQGYGDKVRAYFENVLKEYNHIKLPINASRLIKEIKSQKEYCHGPIIKLAPIKEHMYWSKPIYTVPTHNIIMRESTYKEFGSPKELSMKMLLEQTNLQFGHLKNVSHYPIDLKPYEKSPNLQAVSTMDSTTNLLSMIQKQRIDWIYDSPLFITWYKKIDSNILNEPFKVIHASESNKQLHHVAYMACTKSEKGKVVIEKINKHISQSTILKIRHLVRPWLPKGKPKDDFDKYNKSLFGY